MKKLLSLYLFISFWTIADSTIDWNNDLNIYYSSLKEKHINPFTKISEKQFLAELDSLRQESQRLTKQALTIKLMKLTRLIGDGHTAVQLDFANMKKFPIQFTSDGDKIRVLGIEPKYKAVQGATLTHIDGKGISSILKEVSQVTQFVENEYSLKSRNLNYLKVSEVLFGLGITKNETNAKFRFSNDENTLEVTLFASSQQTPLEYLKTTTPKITSIQKATSSNFWFGTVEGTNTLYINFKEYPSFVEMNQIGDQILKYIENKKLSQLVIDLRGNWGGDFYVGLSLAYYLNLADRIDWLNGVYTLIDNNTFSAATTNATQFKQLLNAKIIGQETGSNPSGFQDMGSFKLPDSGITITYSKRLFRLQERMNKPLSPDVKITKEWKYTENKIDQTLLWVVSDIIKMKN
ncbi:hypothetical protein [uncultured Psychrosphaera sp.]|uniref:hypothetical protein n=1 Tax=uncultured Psychrosphaera sp. TaxID=1403522 RepID=UPI0030FB275A